MAADNAAKPLPPVDVTDAEPLKPADSESGWVAVSSLDDKPIAKPLPPAVSDATLESSRSLMNSLRRGGPGAGRDSASASTTATNVAEVPAKALVAPATSDAWIAAPERSLKVNQILQTAGEDDLSGVISIPSLDEELPPMMETPHVDSLLNTTPSTAAMSEAVEGCVSMKQVKKETKQAKRRSRVARIGGRLIEFYDPDLERLDVDDYDRTILLVSDTDEPENKELAEDDNPDLREARKLFSRKITDIKPTLQYAWGEEKAESLPEDFYSKMDNGEYVSRVAPRMVLQWEPTNLWYYPLYFQDPGLERYGHTRHPLIQPIASTGRFFGQVASLPYQMTLHPPTCPEFALGYYQPGEWAPRKRYRIPFNEEATAVQFLWVTGLILLIP